MKNILSLNLARTTALIITLTGAFGSLGFVLNAGRNNSSVLLVTLFVIWTLSPFLALLIANSVSKSWSVLMRSLLYVLMIVLSVGSVVAYSGLLSFPNMKPAFLYLFVPLVSWLLILTVIPIAVFQSRRQVRKDINV